MAHGKQSGRTASAARGLLDRLNHSVSFGLARLYWYHLCFDFENFFAQPGFGLKPGVIDNSGSAREAGDR